MFSSSHNVGFMKTSVCTEYKGLISQLPAALHCENSERLIEYIGCIFNESDAAVAPGILKAGSGTVLNNTHDTPAAGAPDGSKTDSDACPSKPDSPTKRLTPDQVSTGLELIRQIRHEVQVSEDTITIASSELGWLGVVTSALARQHNSAALTRCPGCRRTILACRMPFHRPHCVPAPLPSNISKPPISVLRASRGGPSGSRGSAGARSSPTATTGGGRSGSGRGGRGRGPGRPPGTGKSSGGRNLKNLTSLSKELPRATAPWVAAIPDTSTVAAARHVPTKLNKVTFPAPAVAGISGEEILVLDEEATAVGDGDASPTAASTRESSDPEVGEVPWASKAGEWAGAATVEAGGSAGGDACADERGGTAVDKAVISGTGTKALSGRERAGLLSCFLSGVAGAFIFPAVTRRARSTCPARRRRAVSSHDPFIVGLEEVAAAHRPAAKLTAMLPSSATAPKRLIKVKNGAGAAGAGPAGSIVPMPTAAACTGASGPGGTSGPVGRGSVQTGRGAAGLTGRGAGTPTAMTTVPSPAPAAAARGAECPLVENDRPSTLGSPSSKRSARPQSLQSPGKRQQQQQQQPHRQQHRQASAAAAGPDASSSESEGASQKADTIAAALPPAAASGRAAAAAQEPSSAANAGAPPRGLNPAAAGQTEGKGCTGSPSACTSTSAEILRPAAGTAAAPVNPRSSLAPERNKSAHPADASHAPGSSQQAPERLTAPASVGETVAPGYPSSALAMAAGFASRKRPAGQELQRPSCRVRGQVCTGSGPCEMPPPERQPPSGSDGAPSKAPPPATATQVHRTTQSTGPGPAVLSGKGATGTAAVSTAAPVSRVGSSSSKPPGVMSSPRTLNSALRHGSNGLPPGMMPTPGLDHGVMPVPGTGVGLTPTAAGGGGMIPTTGGGTSPAHVPGAFMMVPTPGGGGAPQAGRAMMPAPGMISTAGMIPTPGIAPRPPTPGRASSAPSATNGQVPPGSGLNYHQHHPQRRSQSQQLQQPRGQHYAPHSQPQSLIQQKPPPQLSQQQQQQPGPPHASGPLFSKASSQHSHTPPPLPAPPPSEQSRHPAGVPPQNIPNQQTMQIQQQHQHNQACVSVRNHHLPIGQIDATYQPLQQKPAAAAAPAQPMRPGSLVLSGGTATPPCRPGTAGLYNLQQLQQQNQQRPQEPGIQAGMQPAVAAGSGMSRTVAGPGQNPAVAAMATQQPPELAQPPQLQPQQCMLVQARPQQSVATSQSLPQQAPPPGFPAATAATAAVAAAAVAAVGPVLAHPRGLVPGTLLTPAQVHATAQAVLQEQQHLQIAAQLQKAQEQLQHAQQLHQQAPHGSQAQNAQQLQQAQLQLQHAQQLFQAQVQLQLQQRIIAASQAQVQQLQQHAQSQVQLQQQPPQSVEQQLQQQPQQQQQHVVPVSSTPQPPSHAAGTQYSGAVLHMAPQVQRPQAVVHFQQAQPQPYTQQQQYPQPQVHHQQQPQYPQPAQQQPQQPFHAAHTHVPMQHQPVLPPGMVPVSNGMMQQQ
ncbi:hypothetical protein Vretimale_4795 [Volvox reticuliferus]|uniref:Uncharacterized protein n=1 Tax=Volvox reticuliferus TaxID=1737510 RepID=A0A8J4G538_9CHLO|nr:hypothetical protein Vretifemale_4215 [Volvox reticuliferus]GIL99826.1 hypothetical protein Vretimale_4795 [Volvox reticuliferus]